MTKGDQIMIVTEILDGLRETVLAKVERVPASWDGYELRLWVSDLVRELYMFKLDRQRTRKYNNTRLVENL